jgi:predicted ester cyclase
MRRYCLDYTSRHDLTVCDEIMDPGYTLHMGGYHMAGRDDAYKPAATRQFRQFPGLGLTVNEIVCSGDRLALRFTEHGASVRHAGTRAAWGGIGLYHWDGQRLLRNFVEQDYFARRRQLAGDGPDPVERPAVAPWDAVAAASNPVAEAAVREWLAVGDVTGVPGLTIDDGRPAARILAVTDTEINDLFSAGDQVAFHVLQHGTVTGEDPEFGGHGPAELYLAGVVTLAGEKVVSGRVIRDRLGLARRLAAWRSGAPLLATGGGREEQP